MTGSERHRSLGVARAGIALAGVVWGLMGLFLWILFTPRRAEDSGWWVGLDVDPVSAEQAAEAGRFAWALGLGSLGVVALHGLAFVVAGSPRWGRTALLGMAAGYGLVAGLAGVGSVAEPASAMPVYFLGAVGVCGACGWAGVRLKG